MKVEFFRKVDRVEFKRSEVVADRFSIDGIQLLADRVGPNGQVVREMIAWASMSGTWIQDDVECDVIRFSIE